MRIAIVDDLAAERTLLKDRLEWQLQWRNVQAETRSMLAFIVNKALPLS